MKQNYNVSYTTPSAGVCIAKSRLKLHDKTSTSYFEKGTVYLQDGQEFSIELFNPLAETIMAKIELNGKVISQNGLVLRPGERVFLERYFDVARKFKFETYTVSNTSEVQQAIRDNGGLKIQFYKEKIVPQYNPYFGNSSITIHSNPWHNTFTYGGNIPIGGTFTNTSGSAISASLRSAGNSASYTSTSNQAPSGLAAGGAGASLSKSSLEVGDPRDYSPDDSAVSYSADIKVHDGSATLDWMDQEFSRGTTQDRPSSAPRAKLASRGRTPAAAAVPKTVETGRVEAGSQSNQTFQFVSKEFEAWAFHTVEFKLLPWSQKTVSSEDINVRIYCSQCGKKTHNTDRFCSVCGNKL